MIGDAIEGALFQWLWNWFMWTMSFGKIVGCEALGSIGLFFLDDEGALARKCLETGIVGGSAEYIELQ